MTFATPPALGGATQAAGGEAVAVPAKFLTGVTSLTPPPTANQMRIQFSMQELNPNDLRPTGPVPAASGPFMGFFQVKQSSLSLQTANLGFYNKTNAGAPTPIAYSDGKQFWAQSDADGKFDLYIVPGAGTDTNGGWIELSYTAGLMTCIPSAVIIIPPKSGYVFDTDLGGPRILEEDLGVVDPSSTSTYNVLLPDATLKGLSNGAKLFLVINGKRQTSSLVSKKSWMNGTTPIFSIDASNTDLITVDKNATLNATNVNTMFFVILDKEYVLLASAGYPFWAQKSSDQLAPPGPPDPDGDPDMLPPTIRQLPPGQNALSGAEIVNGNGVNVDMTWKANTWVQKNGQSLKVMIWLNGYHDGGLQQHQNTLVGSVACDAATTSPQTVLFDVDQFADYGSPHTNGNQLPTMEVQYYVVDTDGVTILKTSPALTIYLDTIPAGE